METRSRKKVNVRFVSDDEVPYKVVAATVSATKPRTRTKDMKNGDQCYQLGSIDLIDVEVQNKPSNLFENGDVAGLQMFGFQTPPRRNALYNKASESVEKKSNILVQSKTGTPVSSRKLNVKHVGEYSPMCQKVLAQSAMLREKGSPGRKSNKTPSSAKKLLHEFAKINRHSEVEGVGDCSEIHYNLRRRKKQNIEFGLSGSDDSGADDFSASGSDWSSGSESSDSDSEREKEDTDQSSKVVLLRMSGSLTPSRSKNHKLTFVPAAEEYFQSHASRKIHTSNHTLGKLRHNLQQEKLQVLLSESIMTHKKELEKLQNNALSLFPKWHLMMREGFNILLYGVGSKWGLINAFHEEIQDPSVVINGFFPSLTIQEIVSSIAEDILNLPGITADLIETVDSIRKEYSLHSNAHLFLVVHNIDGTMLRNYKNQELLAYLSSVPNIHLIASIDHISAPLMWDQNILSMFNFSWWDVTTFQPYSCETSFESSLLVQQTGNLALSSLQNVFRSLTTNAKKIFLLMAEYQKDHKNVSNYKGMPFKKLYSLCRDTLLVSSDLALRSQLTEFLDHHLVKSRRGPDGSECLLIPIEAALLEQFVSDQSAT